MAPKADNMAQPQHGDESSHCLIGEKRKGISLVPTLLLVLQMLCNFKQKSDFDRVGVLQKQGLNNLQRVRVK